MQITYFVTPFTRTWDKDKKQGSRCTLLLQCSFNLQFAPLFLSLSLAQTHTEAHPHPHTHLLNNSTATPWRSVPFSNYSIVVCSWCAPLCVSFLSHCQAFCVSPPKEAVTPYHWRAHRRDKKHTFCFVCLPSCSSGCEWSGRLRVKGKERRVRVEYWEGCNM